MIIRLKFLIQDSDTIPQLRVSDVLKAVKSLLVSIESFIDVI